MSKKEKQEFDYKRYQRLAKLIHSYFCDEPAVCNYGKPVPEEIRDDENLAWEVRQELSRKRLEWHVDCQAAVDAENIAAQVEFGKGGKVRKR